MRLAILIAGFCIAYAIRKDWLEDRHIHIMVIILIVSMAMDIIEFLKNQSRND